MKLQIKEFAKLTGVSVRTLHYYDEIGLLKPCFINEENGYRYYDENSLLKMQEILYFRELDFPLSSIKELITSPEYNRALAFKNQKKLLTLKKERLERLIDALDKAAKGEIIMNAFENKEYDTVRKQYEEEAKAKYSSTDAYKESEIKTKGYTKEKWNDVGNGMDEVLSLFADCKNEGNAADSEKAQSLVKKLQDYITENFYTCTDEILAGLGQMYVYDERFKNNIDKHGEGTAEYISKAIKIYCNK